MLNLRTIIFLLPFFITAFWFVILLLDHSGKYSSKKILALFMLCGIVNTLSGIAFFGGYYKLYGLIYAPAAFCTILLFPLFYIYIRNLSSENKLNRSDLLLHLIIPIMVGLIAVINSYICFTSQERYIFVSQYLTGKSIPEGKFLIAFLSDSYSKFAFVALGLFYYIQVNRRVIEHRKIIIDYFSNTENASISWIWMFNLAFFMITVSGIFFHSQGRDYVSENEWTIYITYLSLSLFFMIIGYFGSRQVENYPDKYKDPPYIDTPEGSLENNTSANINSEILSRIADNLDKLSRKRKFYLEKDLTLPAMARELGTNRSYLSAALQKELKTNFNQYINELRVKEAIRLINNSTNSNRFTLRQIASASGFSSYITFNRWFSSITGQSPANYRQLQK